jgi:hypothetical protein
MPSPKKTKKTSKSTVKKVSKRKKSPRLQKKAASKREKSKEQTPLPISVEEGMEETIEEQPTKPIFIDEKNEPLKFYLSKQVRHPQLFSMIEKYGGRVVVKPSSDSITIVSDKDEIEQIKPQLSGSPVIDFSYIVDCIKFYTILPVEDYVLTGASEKKPQRTSITLQEVVGAPEREKGMAPKASLSDASFSHEEDMLLLKLVEERLIDKSNYNYTGHGIFREIYDTGKLPNHTISALRKRYIEYIAPILLSTDKKPISASASEMDMEFLEVPTQRAADFVFSTQIPATQFHQQLLSSPTKGSGISHTKSSRNFDDYERYSAPSYERNVVVELAKNCGVHYTLAVFAIYSSSGNVALAERFLKDPRLYHVNLWSHEDDLVILSREKYPEDKNIQSKYQKLISKRRLAAVTERRQFLQQVCQ